ncbi:MAG: hypothetical protein AB7L28_18220 [Kofleriaceae bacterium]
MRSLDTILQWARLDDPDARADAAHELGKFALDWSYRDAVQPALVRLLGDADARVAGVALEAIPVDPMWAAVYVGGLASEHDIVRTTCERRLSGMVLTWNDLGRLGLGPAQGITLVHTDNLVSAIVSGESGSDAAADELARRDLTDITLADLRVVEASLARFGRDAAWLKAHVEARREAAMRNRRAPRANKTKYLSGFLADVESENVDGAADFVFMLTPGDWATLAAELVRMEPELRVAILEAIGYGPARGLFILLDQLSGAHAHVAAEAIARMCERLTSDVALTLEELALVKQHVSDLVEPFLIGS